MAAPPRISLHTTNYNTMPFTRPSLESVLGRLQGLNWEMAVTDNLSTDGSCEVLKEFADRGLPITVLRRRCNRGTGRDLALRSTRGAIALTFDLDTVYNDAWRRMVDWYLERRPAYALVATYSGCYPRAALDAVGGWRDFQYWEDVDLWIRLASKGLYRTYPMRCGENQKPPPAAGQKTPRLYAKMRDTMAVGDWIPFAAYRRGYAALFPLGKDPRRALYYRGVLWGALMPARLKRWRLCRRDYSPEAMLAPEVFVDLGLVPGAELRPLVSAYDTREGVAAAVRRGDYGFLPGTYD